jgi:hypothetical protein
MQRRSEWSVQFINLAHFKGNLLVQTAYKNWRSYLPAKDCKYLEMMIEMSYEGRVISVDHSVSNENDLGKGGESLNGQPCGFYVLKDIRIF